MAVVELTSFWIKSPIPHAPFGIGVTAYSLADALAIIRAVGFGDYLPDDLKGVQIVKGITFGELDLRHVVPNMGPIALRGMWYPFVGVGLPDWAEERISGHPT